MVKRGELTDEAWARIAPLLPEKGRRGGQWRSHREVVNESLPKRGSARRPAHRPCLDPRCSGGPPPSSPTVARSPPTPPSLRESTVSPPSSAPAKRPTGYATAW